MLADKLFGESRKFLSSAVLVIFVLYCLCATVYVTTLPLAKDRFFSVFVFCVAFFLYFMAAACIGLDLLASVRNKNKNAVIPACLKLAFILADYLVLGIVITPLAVIADGIEEDKIFKNVFTVDVIFIFTIFFLSMLGLIENNRGNSFGFCYRTHYACFIFCMTLYWCIVKNGWLTWLGELMLLLLTACSLIFTRAKTVFIFFSLLTIVTFCRHYSRNGGTPYQNLEKFGVIIPVFFRIVYVPVALINLIAEKMNLLKCKNFIVSLMKYSYIIATVIIYSITLSFRTLQSFWEKVPGLRTLRGRLIYGTIGFEEFSAFNLFGNSIRMSGSGGSEKSQEFYFYLDSSYIRYQLTSGLIIFVLVIGLMTWTQFRLCKNKRYYAMFLLSIFAFDSMIEQHLTQFMYNIFIFLAFCKLSKKPGIEVCEKINFTKTKRFALFAAALIFCVWSFTAYRITNWRGWTPHYGATVVIPGDYVDLVKDEKIFLTRLTRAKFYLNSHQDSMCISGENGKKWLIEHGIDEERILTMKAETLEEMLKNSNRLIAEKNLPSRLTVCTYDIQQARIERSSKELKIPVSSLTMKVPGKLFLKSFAAEQWKIIQEL